MWEMINNENKAKGIKEIGEGSTCFEHSYEFWGTWRVEKPGIILNQSTDGQMQVESTLLTFLC